MTIIDEKLLKKFNIQKKIYINTSIKLDSYNDISINSLKALLDKFLSDNNLSDAKLEARIDSDYYENTNGASLYVYAYKVKTDKELEEEILRQKEILEEEILRQKEIGEKKEKQKAKREQQTYAKLKKKFENKQ